MLRTVALVALGASSAIRGLSYVGPTAPNVSPTQLAFVDELIPLSVYAVGWILAGVLCLAAIGWRKLEPAGFAFVIGLNGLWAFSFTASWLFLDVGRAYVSAASYATIAVCAVVIAGMRSETGGGQCRGPR